MTKKYQLTFYHFDRGSGCLYVRTEHQRVQLCDIRPDHLWIFHSGKRCDVFQTEKDRYGRVTEKCRVKDKNKKEGEQKDVFAGGISEKNESNFG